MEIDRRSLMKGMLAGGALLAFGSPAWAMAEQPARRPKQCVLLLGGTSADERFADGARAACAGLTDEGPQTVQLKGGLLGGTDRIAALLKESRGTRWIAIMDDASAVIFLELARPAGVRLLSMGTHACSTERSCPLRHTWATTSPAHGVGGLLASQLVRGQDNFSITERFLQEPPQGRTVSGWSAPGFSSYRSGEADAMHLHCSGLSLVDGCRMLDLETTEAWTSIPRQVCACDSVTWQSKNWAESVGYAVAASAVGLQSVRESCVGRAFVHQLRDGTRTQPTEHFVSFVMDL